MKSSRSSLWLLPRNIGVMFAIVLVFHVDGQLRSRARRQFSPLRLHLMMPKRWIDKKAKLNLATHFNFVSDADIIGGNSGSPVVNKENEFVGIIFDGNIQSLVLASIYTDTHPRAVRGDSVEILEALHTVS